MGMVSFPGFPSLLKSPGSSWRKQKELSCQSLGTNPVPLPQSTATELCLPSTSSVGALETVTLLPPHQLKMVSTDRWQISLKKKANSGISSLPSTWTPQPQTLIRLDNFRCLGGLTHCTSGCPGLASLLQPQQLNHLRDKEVQKQINSR